MRLLVLSDIHADLRGLEAVLADAGTHGWEQALLLGDLVGYGSEPRRTLELLDELPLRAAIGGNHEVMLGELRATGRVNAVRHVQDSLQLCLDELSAERLDRLQDLPEAVEAPGWQAVHGAPRRRFEYVLSAAAARQNEPHLTRDICLVGHTHVPGAYLSDGPGRWRVRPCSLPSSLVRLEPGVRAFLNPGSVHRTRDSGSERSYGILDEEAREFLVTRLPV